MLETPPAHLRLTVDTGALTDNWRALDHLSGKAAAGAAVKANAYGVGIESVVPALADAGCKSFFVAHWAEAAELLNYVPAAQISVLHGPLTTADANFARSTGVKPVINSLHQARLWQDTGGGICDLMIDTGINRLGLSPNEVSDRRIAELDVDILMSHLASGDEDNPFNHMQMDAFRSAAARVGYQRLSLANSAGIALGHEFTFDLTRPGLALYGGIPRPELDGIIKPVVGIDAAVLQTRMLSAGDTVGYNATFTAPHSMRVGVVSLGYADGYLRSWAGWGMLQYHGAALPVLGKVSMDMIVVDLTDAANCQEGDWLTVPYALPEAARKTGLSQYELLTILGQRFSR